MPNRACARLARAPAIRLIRSWKATMQTITDKKAIYELSLNDPIVYRLLIMVELGQITFEQAMMSGVSILSEQNAELLKMCTGLVATSAQITSLPTLREIQRGLSPSQEKDIEQIINRALHSGIA